MNTDNPNMNNLNQDRKKWWEAKKAEHLARMEKMAAEDRMRANDALNNFSEEFDAAVDWTEASWNEFTAKVEAWWTSDTSK